MQQYLKIFKTHLLLILPFFCSNIVCHAQSIGPVWLAQNADSNYTLVHDTLLKNIITQQKTINSKDSLRASLTPDFVNHFLFDFFATATAFTYHNAPENFTEKNRMQLFYNINISNELTIKKVQLNTRIYNELGYIQYFDSTGHKGEDLLTCNNNLMIPIRKSKFNVSAGYNIKTQLHKEYTTLTDSTNTKQRRLYTDYFSPGYVLYTGGVTYNFWKNCTAEFGLVGGMLTKIKNTQIFETRQESNLYGVEKDKKQKIEYGLNLIVSVPVNKIHKNIYWENNLRLFAPNTDLNDPKKYLLDVNNAVHFVFLKYLRISWRNKLQYNNTISSKIFLSNQIGIGFYLSNNI